MHSWSSAQMNSLNAYSPSMRLWKARTPFVKELTAHSVLVTEHVLVDPDVAARHVAATRWVHAGIVRAAIGTIMACLDPEDSRRNRASVGQIIETLKDQTLVNYFARAGQGSMAALQQARERYEALQKDDLFDRAKWLRNDVVAHILIRRTPTPKVNYEDVYDLRDAAEQIVTDLIAPCGRQKPKRTRVTEQAKFFWDIFVGHGPVAKSAQKAAQRLRVGLPLR
jgi:AbiU2